MFIYKSNSTSKTRLAGYSNLLSIRKYFTHRVLEAYKKQFIRKLQGDQKVSVSWWLQYRKLQVMFKVSPANHQTFIDTRLTLTPSVISKPNYVIMVSEWNCLKCVRVFFVL
jgi:hypothetical protein